MKRQKATYVLGALTLVLLGAACATTIGDGDSGARVTAPADINLAAAVCATVDDDVSDPEDTDDYYCVDSDSLQQEVPCDDAALDPLDPGLQPASLHLQGKPIRAKKKKTTGTGDGGRTGNPTSDGGGGGSGCSSITFAGFDTCESRHPYLPMPPPDGWRSRRPAYGPPRGTTPSNCDWDPVFGEGTCTVDVAGTTYGVTCRRHMPGGRTVDPGGAACRFHCYFN